MTMRVTSLILVQVPKEAEGSDGRPDKGDEGLAEAEQRPEKRISAVGG